MSTRARSRCLRSVLCGAVASWVLPIASAAAEDAPAGRTLDEIVVVGSRPIAESEQAALEVQRASESLVSVLAADGIGRLPDQNIAQAVSRLPGVGVQRDQGQARYINLRGSPLNWTTLSFDGIFVISPEGRDSRYDSIPSAIASQVVVQKAVTPDLSGETIAGNVNIVTRSPFDYEGFRLAGKAGAGVGDLGSKGEYEASLVLSNRRDTSSGEWGVLVSGSFYQRDMVTDNFEVDWEEVSRDLRPLAAGETGPRVWARELENKFYRLKRRNYSGSGRIEWRPDPANRLFISSIYTVFTDDELRDNYRIDADDQEGRVPNAATACPSGSAQPPAPFTTGYADVCTGNTPFLGTIYGVDFDARFRLTGRAQSLFTNTLGGDHELGDWKLAWRANYTRSVDNRSDPFLHSYQSPSFGTNGTGAVNRVSVDYDLRDPSSSQVRLFRTLRSSTGVFSKGDPVDNYQSFPNTITSATGLDAKDVTKAYTGKIDASVDTAFLGETTVKFGLQYDKRSKEANEFQLSVSGATLVSALTAAGIDTRLNGILGSDPFKGKIRPGYTLTHFSKAKGEAILNVAKTLGTYNPVTANFYDVGEEVYSGYLMATTRFDWGNIVYGARVEHIKNSGEAFVTLPVVGSRLVSVETDRTLAFPSAHVNWNPREDMKLRLSFNTGAARPDYTVARPNFTVNDGNGTISGGNPEASPERAWGVDAYWEWYIQPRGFLSVGVFYKDVSKALFSDSQVFGLDVLNTPDRDRSQYTLSTVVNGGSGYIWGAEAAVQLQLDPFLETDSFFGGFGIQANVTYNESEATTPDGRKVSFPGTSQWVVNVGPYFEKYGVSARLSYQMRTAWFSEIGGPDTGGDLFWAKDTELDFSARYAVTDALEVYFDAANLLNGAGRRYAGISDRTLEHETFGRRFTGGVRVTF